MVKSLTAFVGGRGGKGGVRGYTEDGRSDINQEKKQIQLVAATRT